MAFALGCLLLALTTRLCGALDDPATNLAIGTTFVNFELADASGSDDTVFNDTSRFARSSADLGSITYNSTTGFSNAAISFFAYSASPEWKVQVFAGEDPLYSIDGAKVATFIAEQSSETKKTDIDHVVVQLDTATPSEGWYAGLLVIDLLGLEPGCISSIRIEIAGGNASNYWAVQLGTIQASEPFASLDKCTEIAAPQLQSCPASTGDCPVVSVDGLLAVRDDADASVDPGSSLFSQSNLLVATDSPGDFGGDATRYARRDTALEGSLSYRFQEGGVSKVEVALAYCVDKPVALQNVYVSIRPYPNISCRPSKWPRHNLELNIKPEPLGGCWQYTAITFNVGELRGLNCVLPQFVDLAFYAPPGSDIEILSVTLTGKGAGPPGLAVVPIPNDADEDSSIPKLYIYIGAGLGALVLLVGFAFLLYCCLYKGTPERKKDVVARSNSRNSSGDNSDQAWAKPDPARGYVYSPHSMVTVPVNCSTAYTVPQDGPYEPLGARLGSESDVRNTHNGFYLEGGVVDVVGGPEFDTDRDASIDLAMPTPTFAGAPGVRASRERLSQRVPRADIFETWQALDNYNSGADSEDWGPTDSRNHSFTNPDLSASQSNSPSHNSSALGVTKQIGMRIKELKNSMAEHQTPQRGAVTPVPLEVAYGKKIGAGGFGAVYEGQWNGKSVAIKVIKMPEYKPGEEKEKMAIMEYAISGLLLHVNIVQTYQADIRPIYLEEPANANEAASGWTGIQEYLSTDITQQAKQVHEWEVRLIMEYCGRGNLKEAIRKGSLRNNGRTLAFEVALLALDIAKGCQAIHKYKIIHGDLKPHNVLLTADAEDMRGWVGKIADFGLSVKIESGAEHVSGIQHGTEGYVAPEVLQTRRMVKASDVYSFGILMWEMWHSKLYYEEYRAAVKRMGRLTLDFRPTFERECPEEWVDLAKKCWQNKPEERPDFARIVKMMDMIVSSIKNRIGDDGTL